MELLRVPGMRADDLEAETASHVPKAAMPVLITLRKGVAHLGTVEH